MAIRSFSHYVPTEEHIEMGMPPEARAQIKRYYDGTLLPDQMMEAMANDCGWFPSRAVSRGVESTPFVGPTTALPDLAIQDQGRTFDAYDYLSANRVAGLMILKDGKRLVEQYSLGIDEDTRWKSCSLAKSVTSTLAGIAVAEGVLDLDAPVTRYARVGGIYRDVSVRQLLRMASGIRWRETYEDPTSDRRQLMDIQVEWEAGSILRFMESLPPETPPGGSWKYNTGESYVVSAVMEGATGMNLADYLTTRIWSRIGMEADAYWWTESEGGMVVSGSGLSATMRDYARFGQFVLDEGRYGDQQLLPDGWNGEAGAPYYIDGKRIPYGYMWWIPELDDPELQGTFQAEGVYGQFIHINPRKRLVVVVLSARSKPSYKRRLEINDDAFFAELARVL